MNLYFRIRDNGAAVYRLDTENRNRRLEMIHIANANLRNGEVRPQGGNEPTEGERAEIAGWIAARRTVLAAREAEAPERLIESLNEVAQWLQSRASDAEAEGVSDRLLMAMHDLRSVIVRRKSDMLRDG
jgi:hypothetical protein